VLSPPKHVLVTGASRGLGFGIVRNLISHGYLVSSVSRRVDGDLQALCKEAPGRLFIYECDLRNLGDGHQLIQKVESTGALYALVNNAGIANEGLLIGLSEARIRETIEVDLIAALLLSRVVAKRMVRARNGRIVSISSIVTRRASRGLTVYAAAKAALESFSRCLALELGPRNVTVNVIAPGFLDTDMTATLTPQQRNRVVARTPLSRAVTVDDVAEGVLFLLSDAAASVTGSTIVVDGGSSL
jgi:3-oxoacyl-[acyl-carrier protein] reductase